MTSRNARRNAARSVKIRAKAVHPEGPEECLILGCPRSSQRSARRGLSTSYCRVHQNRIRRHGHPTRRSYKAPELEPYQRAARAWLKEHRETPRVEAAVGRLLALIMSAGRSLRADYHASAPPREKARSVLARLHEARKSGEQLLEAALVVQAINLDDGPRGWPDWVPVQVAKIVNRLQGVAGTHPWKHGVELPSRYPRPEGGFMRIVGQKIMDRASIAIDEGVIEEVRRRASSRRVRCSTQSSH